MSIESRLEFDNGRIAAVAKTQSEETQHEATNALIGSGANYRSAFFGAETSVRYSSVSAIVRLEGVTPLSIFTLSETPALAVFDTQLKSEHIYWGVPEAQR